MITGKDLRIARKLMDLTLEDVAHFGTVSPGHLSRIESGERSVTPATIALYERATGRPLEASADDPVGPNVEPMRRKDVFKLAGVTFMGSLGLAAIDPASDEVTECAQTLAWEIWHLGRDGIHESEVPQELRAATVLLLQQLQLIRSPEGMLRFAHPGLIDFHIACRVYGGISTGSSTLLASAQTSHATDLVIRQYVGQDHGSARSLSDWMTRGSNAVLRVNAAGILAKVPSATIADSVITALRADQATRHLYLTAVAHRVLGMPWQEAYGLAGTPSRVQSTADVFSVRLADELRNPRDAAARWCSAVLLYSLGLTDHEPIKAAVAHALHTESARENLRTMAALLAGIDPVAA